jgi:hypothetical protein
VFGVTGRTAALALALVGAGCGGGASSPKEPPAPSEPTSEPTSEPAPPPEPAAPAVEHPGGPFRAEVKQLLSAVIDREAGNPANAWALAHGVLAKGPGFLATDGRRAIDVLVDDFMQAERLPGHKGLQPFFPTQTEAGVPVEPHTDLILKTLVEVGLPLEEPLTARAGSPALERLLRSSQARAVAAPGKKGAEAFARPDDVAWSIQAWCQGAYAGGAETWLASNGKDQNVDAVALQQLEMLEAETWFMRTAMNAGGTVQKRRQGIFGFTCGGAHLYQSVTACAAAGFPKGASAKERIGKLNEIYLWRIKLETGLIEDAMRTAPKLAPLLYNQDVKFLGHMLESLGKAERDGLFTPTADERLLLQDAEGRLLAHVLQMSKLGVYQPDKLAGWMTSADEGSRQFYLDVVGDACHAWNGLKLHEALREARAAAPSP